ncbi:MAG: hypothetical protein K2G61_03980, partial [Bacteroidaceae bacterium]|nr:hypothetical protein [Bacteroidaceae bacterium]
MKQYLLFALALAGSTTALAQQHRVERLHITTEQTALPPFRTDTVDVDRKQWDDNKTLMANATNLMAWKNVPATTDSILAAPASNAVRLAGFSLRNQDFAKVDIKVEGLKGEHEVWVDGQKNTHHELVPGEHDVTIKFLQKAGETDTLRVSFESQQNIRQTEEGERHPFTLDNIMYGEHIGGATLSADGRFVMMHIYNTMKNGSSNWKSFLIDTKT